MIPLPLGERICLPELRLQFILNLGLSDVV